MTTTKKKTGSASALDFQIINWIGIIEQLSSTQAKRLLDGTDVPMPQFILLNHFSHRPDEGKTVSNVAWAMQQPQPGITKTLAKMVSNGFLKEEPNPEDGRSKILFLTEQGKQSHALAQSRLIHGMSGVFDDWEETDKKQLFSYLDRLKIYFDDNR
ncbi:MarR family winged helix-turn-helix transcriptional regulator [Sneathiella sp.]|jgi:DNA-binding MarR family transcriptional regulator|uniref:MarR family winged helix-turn-helix transcriptional regulator n=1 Tax=Sneathiella sp. TaxID=1964365 RepID=UPI0039E67840